MQEFATTTKTAIGEAEAPRDPDWPDVEAARQGDLRAASRLYRRYQRRVTQLACFILGSERDAEDICQETFVHALQGLGRFRGESAFSTWLCRIAVNESRDLYAKRRRRELWKRVGWGREQPLSERPLGELRLGLSRALSRLSRGQREVLVCHDVLGMRHEEIAFTLGCAVATSRVQLHKARVRVRELLNGSDARGE